MNPPDNRQAPARNWVPFGVAAALLLVSLFSLFVLRLLDTLADKEALLSVLSSKHSEVTMLEGHVTGAFGKVMRDRPAGRVVLYVSGLPVAPPGKEYHVWLMKEDTSLSVGVFAVKERGGDFFLFERFPGGQPDSGETFAVTLEPGGPASYPPGELYLKGSR